jgi:hypothetical protein
VMNRPPSVLRLLLLLGAVIYLIVWLLQHS